jgi:hypothetical protein
MLFSYPALFMKLLLRAWIKLIGRAPDPALMLFCYSGGDAARSDLKFVLTG